MQTKLNYNRVTNDLKSAFPDFNRILSTYSRSKIFKKPIEKKVEVSVAETTKPKSEFVMPFAAPSILKNMMAIKSAEEVNALINPISKL